MNAAFYTLGCKVNQYETENMKESFIKKGFSVVPPSSKADVYVLNSCTVTANSDRKTRQMLHRFRRLNPSAVIAVVGCYPQADENAPKALSEADIIMGAKNRSMLVQRVEEVLASRKKIVDIKRHEKGEPFEPMLVSEFDGHTRAFLKIQDGCDRYCSYCIIPKARGHIRSKPLEDIVSELSALAQNGYSEVVLAGINLSSYGREMGHTLTEAVEAACGIDKVRRVRLGSLEPDLLSDEDIKRMSALDKLCPQFHLSLQSGCDQTLKRMNRHYTSGEYAEVVAKIRRAFKNPSITTDVMVGFPGETKEEFLASLEFVKSIGFSKVHVFPYSPREGTPAAVMDNQISRTEKERRSKIMNDAAKALRLEFMQSQVGLLEQVLFETEEEDKISCGYTMNYTPVAVPGASNLTGTIRTVKITAVDGERCIGQLAD